MMYCYCNDLFVFVFVCVCRVVSCAQCCIAAINWTFCFRDSYLDCGCVLVTAVGSLCSLTVTVSELTAPPLTTTYNLLIVMMVH